jgi:hypothetical protein
VVDGALSAAAPLSVESLMDEAASRAASDDWGDLGFTATLGLLLDSCTRSAALTPAGWGVLRSVVLRHLRNRLALQDRLRCRPDLRDGPTTAVVVTGLPRTGTTLVHNLLALDGELRALRLWEALRPFPPLGEKAPGKAALVEQAQAWLARFYQLAPGMRAVHPATAEGPEECDALLQNSFASQHIDDMVDADAYSAWFATDPLRDEYRYYALQLAAMTEDERGAAPDGGADASGLSVPPEPGAASPASTWVLKSPGHLGHLDALLDAIPRAVVLHCHRHPVEAVPSYASLIRTVRAPHTERLDPGLVGRQALERSCLAVRRALAVREAAGASRFVDVSYGRLVAEPLAVMGEVYDRLGRPLRAEVRADMGRWLVANPQHLHGPHNYGLDDFALNAGQVSDAFAPYLDRLGSWMTG